MWKQTKYNLPSKTVCLTAIFMISASLRTKNLHHDLTNQFSVPAYCNEVSTDTLLWTSSSSSVTCQTTGPKPLPKWFLNIVRSRVSSFNWQYPLLSLRSSSSFLRLLFTSICPFIFHSIICCRRQFLRKMWPIQLAFRFLISCRIFLCSLTLSNTSSFLTWSVQLIFSILLQHHISRRFWYRNHAQKKKQCLSTTQQ